MKNFKKISITAMLVALVSCVSVFGLSQLKSSANSINVGVSAEWKKAKEAIMHTPGEELFLGVIHPDAALFERPFSIQKASEEHKKYIEELENRGVKVHTVINTLIDGTIDANGQVIEGEALKNLRKFAREFISVDASGISQEEQLKQDAYLDDVISKLHPRELVSVILNQPIVHLRKTEINTGYEASYEMKPVMNLYFLRDQMITTNKGVVLSKMNSSQRAVETKIIKFVLNKLGINPIHEVYGDGRLEGGDFIPAGDTAFIGQGVRTNQEAIDQLLEKDAFGSNRVVVVREKWKNQEQMHLDTYFNIISEKLGVLVESRYTSKDKKPNDTMRLTVDVFEKDFEGKYIQVEKGRDFQDYVENVLGIKLIPVSSDDQLKYGINFLTVESNKILAVDGVSKEYKEVLKNAGVDATWMDFSNLTGGYGAAHCSIQVISREK